MIQAYRTNTKDTKSVMRLLQALTLTLIILFSFLVVAFVGNSDYKTKEVNYTYEKVTVQKGDTLWGLTAKVNDTTDTNRLVHKAMAYNHLSSTYIQPGQIIYVPVQF